MLFCIMETVSDFVRLGCDVERTHVNSPKLLNRVKGDDLFQQVIPVVVLQPS
jgi:hypothetical protein